MDKLLTPFLQLFFIHGTGGYALSFLDKGDNVVKNVDHFMDKRISSTFFSRLSRTRGIKLSTALSIIVDNMDGYARKSALFAPAKGL